MQWSLKRRTISRSKATLVVMTSWPYAAEASRNKIGQRGQFIAVAKSIAHKAELECTWLSQGSGRGPGRCQSGVRRPCWRGRFRLPAGVVTRQTEAVDKRSQLRVRGLISQRVAGQA